jgi:predicted anti-sigma-YlaC factor YlaD
MKAICQSVQERMVSGEPLPDDACGHLSACVECRRFEEALATVDAELKRDEEPTAVLERDKAEALVASVLRLDGKQARVDTRTFIAYLGIAAAAIGGLVLLVQGYLLSNLVGIVFLVAIAWVGWCSLRIFGSTGTFHPGRFATGVLVCGGAWVMLQTPSLAPRSRATHQAPRWSRLTQYEEKSATILKKMIQKMEDGPKGAESGVMNEESYLEALVAPDSHRKQFQSSALQGAAPSMGLSLDTCASDPNSCAPVAASKDALARESLDDDRPQISGAINKTHYLDPNGYWENTYTPGSPLLATMMESLPLNTLSPSVRTQVLQAARSLSVVHSDAPPSHGAVALTATTDHVAVSSPTRTLLQITINGAERAKGTRPPLSLAVVIPRSMHISAEQRPFIEQMLRELEAQRRVDDRIFVFGDFEPLRPESFRFGPLSLLVKTFASPSGNTSSGVTDTPREKHPAALFSEAAAAVLDDEPTTLRERAVFTLMHDGMNGFRLGSSDIDTLVLAGGVASFVTFQDDQSILKLAARGQGSYRLVTPKTSPREVITHELRSLGTVVARALRLNIRLNPHAKLIEVIGSKKLSEHESRRDKEVEAAIDQRIARSMGIEADRGGDDPGIQILIPRFLAQGQHTITLDLMVEGPGPVADISLRSKDLVLLKNHTSQVAVSLPSHTSDKSMYREEVRHNALAQRIAAVIRDTRASITQGSSSAAIQQFRERTASIFAQDPHITDALALAAALETLSTQPSSHREEVQNYLSVLHDTVQGFTSSSAADGADDLTR